MASTAFLTRLQKLLGTVGLSALLIALRYAWKKKRIASRNALLHGDQVAYADFDVIVVGGGTSGCVLASRLSENPRIRVLLVEAGGSGKALPFTRVPSGFGRLFWTKHVFPFYTEPQTFASERRRFWPRAKMLGGCSSINAQMAQFGAPEDFDQWGSFMNDDSWSWKNFRQYFNKFETYKPDSRYPQVDTSVRGKTGPIRVGYFNTVSNSAKAFIDACIEVGIPFTPDFNGPNGTMGVSRSAYLTSEVLSRPNLSVVIHSTVTRILFETIDGETRAVGVEYAETQWSKRYRVKARKEVILSAGAVHTPHILILSGIGPADQLKEHDIPIVQELPGVGRNLVDHPVVDVSFKDKLDSSPLYLQPNGIVDIFRLFKTVAQYHLGFGGTLAMNFGESAAFIRSDDPTLFPPSQYPLPSNGPMVDSTSSANSPDLEIFTTPFAYKEHGKVFYDVHTRALHVYLLRPTSTGQVGLKSKNPFDLPSVNPNYLQTPEDLAKLVRGVQMCLRIAQAKPLCPFIDHECQRDDLDQGLDKKTNEELERIVKERVDTVYHPTSTCRMAPLSEGGVVDSKLRVYGLKGLRVCDTSFFPWIVSGHTAGACFAAAEKLADEIKAEF
ncbi:choline dehydrogenase [Dendrothele bispora CBS 962.96]|uniref:Choline dehydrogenase n=1 Tax=Dendrothele bispora (strain CBS 962.96) TaxID=1314807 RepID=A0A4S8MVE4_DENBC|nr:choline dehydrogenase [Dendrothele bispora CBS 962.96]